MGTNILSARGLGRYSVKVGGTMSMVAGYDAYAVRRLEEISDHHKDNPSLLSRVFLALNPFGAFALTTAEQIEKEVKQVFIDTATKIIGKAEMLIKESDGLEEGLTVIQSNLDKLREVSVDETGSLPNTGNALSALWLRLARSDDWPRHKRHAVLLADVDVLYKQSSHVVQITSATLNRLVAELIEFREQFEKPGKTLGDLPINLTIEVFRDSLRRVEAGNKALRAVEDKWAVPVWEPKSSRSKQSWPAAVTSPATKIGK